MVSPCNIIKERPLTRLASALGAFSAILVFMSFSVPRSAAAASAATALDLAAIEQRVDTLMLASDPSGKNAQSQVAAIEEAIAPLEGALAAQPRDPGLLYLRAFAHFAASVPLRFAQNREGTASRWEKALSSLEKIKHSPLDAEAQALEGYLYMQLVAVKGGEGALDLAQKSSQLLAHSLSVAPQNPRVLLLNGLVLWTVPATFGGDQSRGLKLLQAAADAFAQEAKITPTNSVETPRWGQCYALGWLGTALKRKGDNAGARAVWIEALSLDPGYALIRDRSLPSLDRKS